jgi:hypothetical protein
MQDMTSSRPEAVDSAAQEILGYSFLRVFVHNAGLDEEELRTIEDLALRDGVVDSKERAVLARIFDRLDPERLDGVVRAQIQQFRETHGIR